MKAQQRYPDLNVSVVETERNVAAHQSGHNSGVLHSGIYYKPGSRKAINCRTGLKAMESFCSQHSIPHERCGKVVVATTEQELPRLDAIAERATQNGVAFNRLDTDALRECEPSAAGLAAIHVPETGIVNYRVVCETMADEIRTNGGSIELGFEVCQIETQDESVVLTSRTGEKRSCGHLVNCGGLNSDRVFAMAGGKPTVRIVPFRGEYFELASGRESLCRNLIYPVPDPSFPFLGVHFTRMIDGGVECGPNAVLALSRRGYSWRDFSFRDTMETLKFGGFRSLASKHWRMGLGEMHRSLSKSAFVTALQKLIPSLKSDDLVPGRAGVRAQAVTPEGNLLDDFLFERSRNAIHVLNAPSPAATASLAIADQVLDKLESGNQ
jgi:L-2-hydroxyglutarate oxidase